MPLPSYPLTPHALVFFPGVPEAVGFNDREVGVARAHPAEGERRMFDDLLRFYFFHKLLH